MKKSCDCIAKLDKLLPEGEQLDVVITLSGRVFPAMRTVRGVTAKGKPKKGTIIASTYCPFCGKKYPE